MKHSFLLFTTLTLCSAALASEEFVPLQQFAQGQSLSGSHLLNDSLYTNPAASAFTNVYSVDATYALPRSYAVSILDTKTSSLAGGLGYFRRMVTNPSDGKDFHDPLQGVKLGLASKASQSFAVGIAGKALWGPGLQNGVSGKLNDIDVGFLTTFKGLQFGGAVTNILGGNLDMDQGREFTAGGRIGYDDLLFLSVSTQSRFSEVKPYQYGIGAEYVSPYYFSLKGGYRIRPQEHASFWSVGASIISPVVSVHYAMQIPNQHRAADRLEHILGISLLL